MITKEEQLQLLKSAQNGDIEAFSRIVDDLIPFVKYIKKRELISYERYGIDVRELSDEDILQSGFLGLISAVNGYRSDKGGSFTTYAYKYIQGEIKKQIAIELNRTGVTASNKIIFSVSIDDEENYLEETLSYDEDMVLKDIIALEEQDEDRKQLSHVISSLTEVEKNILFMVNGIDTEQTSNQLKIARRLGLSEIEVRRNLSNAMNKIKNVLGE